MDEIDQLIRDAVAAIDARAFDSHEVILRLARDFQRRYVKLLHDSTSETPFRDVHGKIGRRLKALAGELGLSEGIASASSDIFGNIGECVAYTRLPTRSTGM